MLTFVVLYWCKRAAYGVCKARLFEWLRRIHTKFRCSFTIRRQFDQIVCHWCSVKMRNLLFWPLHRSLPCWCVATHKIHQLIDGGWTAATLSHQSKSSTITITLWICMSARYGIEDSLHLHIVATSVSHGIWMADPPNFDAVFKAPFSYCI